MKDLTLFLKSLTPLAVACLLMAAANVIVTIYVSTPRNLDPGITGGLRAN